MMGLEEQENRMDLSRTVQIGLEQGSRVYKNMKVEWDGVGNWDGLE